MAQSIVRDCEGGSWYHCLDEKLTGCFNLAGLKDVNGGGYYQFDSK
jgi:hypothetical protein